MLDRIHRGVACALLSGMILLIADATADSLTDDVSGQTAIARPSSMFTEDGKPERLEFNFGEIKAWLRASGNWHIEGPVPHQGLLCATRQLGIRFGIGSPACTNVRWISDIEYGTSHKQCNNATAWHEGDGDLPALAAEFSRISCAERVVQCSGNCK